MALWLSVGKQAVPVHFFPHRPPPHPFAHSTTRPAFVASTLFQANGSLCTVAAALSCIVPLMPLRLVMVQPHVASATGHSVVPRCPTPSTPFHWLRYEVTTPCCSIVPAAMVLSCTVLLLMHTFQWPWCHPTCPTDEPTPHSGRGIVLHCLTDALSLAVA